MHQWQLIPCSCKHLPLAVAQCHPKLKERHLLPSRAVFATNEVMDSRHRDFLGAYWSALSSSPQIFSIPCSACWRIARKSQQVKPNLWTPSCNPEFLALQETWRHLPGSFPPQFDWPPSCNSKSLQESTGCFALSTDRSLQSKVRHKASHLGHLWPRRPEIRRPQDNGTDPCSRTVLNC